MSLSCASPQCQAETQEQGSSTGLEEKLKSMHAGGIWCPRSLCSQGAGWFFITLAQWPWSYEDRFTWPKSSPRLTSQAPKTLEPKLTNLRTSLSSPLTWIYYWTTFSSITLVFQTPHPDMTPQLITEVSKISSNIQHAPKTHCLPCLNILTLLFLPVLSHCSLIPVCFPLLSCIAKSSQIKDSLICKHQQRSAVSVLMDSRRTPQL